MAWYYQTSPHDTHDWDSAQTPVLVDGEFNGKPRKMVVTASRNGYYFTLDRTDRRAAGHRQVLRDRELGEGTERQGPAGPRSREGPSRRRRAGVVEQRRRDQLAAAGASAPTPGCSTCRRAENYAMYYLTETDPRGAMGLGGKEESRRRRRSAATSRRSTTRPARSSGGTSSDRDERRRAARRAC